MRLALIVLGCLIVSACAFTNVTVNPPARVSTQLSGGDGRELVVHTPFADQRANRQRCGMQKNSMNADTASVICSSDPTRWLADLLVAELAAAGFKVKTEGQTSTAHGVTIDGVLLNFFVEPVIGFSTITIETDIYIKLIATTKNGLNAERIFFVKGSNSAMTGMASNFQPSVDDATRMVVKDMVAAILTLMNRYPELGMNNGHGDEMHITLSTRG